MRILIVTDAWKPQTNGVVTTLGRIRRELIRMHHQVFVLGPTTKHFFTVPCPTYPEIQLALASSYNVGPIIERLRPGAIHVATEGPLGWATRHYCKHHNLPFTSAFHTRFPEYMEARFLIPSPWTYSLLRRFHKASRATMVTTRSIEKALAKIGFLNLKRWSRGVDTEVFAPTKGLDLGLRKPISLYVGRVAVEKNLEAFLDLDIPGSKVVVGDGPQLEELRNKYRHVYFAGVRYGDELVRFYNTADAFVFPSRTDTFGLVMLEALACGVPVAAFPVPGPIDVLTDPSVGYMNSDLKKAVMSALKQKDRNQCRQFAQKFSWKQSARQFVSNLSPIYNFP